ncbi:TetR/AcrR family transcriptional regulator [Paenibacillus sp. J5C_2022]|uniref:TetR/AcrR family transcriptional regulator n=1 Tax=Paenibacillus sp. J5C2022 TaxID=2977129 RepID=UPI0021CE021C|nr:TetR/AcrR family transcriptional regulator [Paenibacillus sp. J5C2022]MCU6707282.1 TetR/AcrR family transcriptional regulator [Paenibacillus sp. J5C2022]
MRRSKAEQKQETIQTLIQTARTQFSELGYAATPLEKLVSDAGMTRGALYHHFGNKEGLFLAVLQSVQQEIAVRIESEASGSDDLWEQLILGCRAFMAAAVADNNRRILLIDGPSVLGWDVWRRTDEQHAMMTLRDQLQIMQTQGILKHASVDALTHLLSGAMNEAVLWIAESSERQQALEESVAAITLLCEGFRAD